MAILKDLIVQSDARIVGIGRASSFEGDGLLAATSTNRANTKLWNTNGSFSTISTLLGSSAIGSASQPVYWNGSALVAGNSIPSVGNGSLSLQVNGTTQTTFTANQSGNATFNVTLPTVPTVYNNKITFKANGTGYRDFTANQSSDTALNFAPGTGIAITGSTGTITTGINSTYQNYISHGETAYNRKYWANLELQSGINSYTEPRFGALMVGRDPYASTFNVAFGYTKNGDIEASGDYGNFATGFAGSYGTILSNGKGSLAGGFSSENGCGKYDESYIDSTANGSFAFGSASHSSFIDANSNGAFAMGSAFHGGTISANDKGTFAMGRAFNGTIESTKYGAFALGQSYRGLISAQNTGSFAMGVAKNDAELVANGIGSFAIGHGNSNGTIRANGDGSLAGGFSYSDGYIHTESAGAFVFGKATQGGELAASYAGSFACGHAYENGKIESSGSGSFAGGFSRKDNGEDTLILAGAKGSFAFGDASNGGIIKSNGFGTFTVGAVFDGGSLNNDSDHNFIFGCASNGGTIEITGAHGSFITGEAADGGYLGTATADEGNTHGASVFGYVGSTGNKILVKASGAHAEGYSNGTIEATGRGAHAEGYVSEGRRTTASGWGSHAEGVATIAGGTGAHAEGIGLNKNKNITVTGVSYSFQGMCKFITSSANLFEVNDVIEVYNANTYICTTIVTSVNSGYIYTGYDAYGKLPNEGAGNAITLKTAQTGSNGYGSHAEGIATVAGGTGSHTEGFLTNATGYYSHAEGLGAQATGYYSHAEGYKSTASGNSSHAEGNGVISNGDASHAEGFGGIKTKIFNVYYSYQGIGVFTVDTNSYIIFPGMQLRVYTKNTNTLLVTTTISSVSPNAVRVPASDVASILVNATYYDIELEALNYAKGIGAHLEGFKNATNGQGAHVEGCQNVSGATGAHAEGEETYASGLASHAEGYKSTAGGTGAHAEGRGGNANAAYSHVEGCYSSVNSEGGHVEGYTYYQANSKGNRAINSGGLGGHIEGYSNHVGHVTLDKRGGHIEGCFISGTLGLSSEGGHVEGFQCGGQIGGTGVHIEGYHTTSGLTSNACGGHIEGYSAGYYTDSVVNKLLSDGAHIEGYGYCGNTTSTKGTRVVLGLGGHIEGCVTGGTMAVTAAGGHVEGCTIDSTMTVTASGGHVEGFVNSSATHVAGGTGAHVEGYAYDKGEIIALSYGSHAEGMAYKSGKITAGSDGTHAEGCVIGDFDNDLILCGNINANNYGAHAEGFAQHNYIDGYNKRYGIDEEIININAKGVGSHAGGYVKHIEIKDGSIYGALIYEDYIKSWNAYSRENYYPWNAAYGDGSFVHGHDVKGFNFADAVFGLGNRTINYSDPLVYKSVLKVDKADCTTLSGLCNFISDSGYLKTNFDAGPIFVCGKFNSTECDYDPTTSRYYFGDGNNKSTIRLDEYRPSFMIGNGTGPDYTKRCNAFVVDYRGNTFIGGSVNSLGDMHAPNFIPTSDERLKNIHGDIELDDCYKLINDARYVKFDFKNDKEKKEHIGLIAQDVQKVFPQTVSEDHNGNLGLNYDSLVAVCMKTIKDLNERVTELEEKLKQYEK